MGFPTRELYISRLLEVLEWVYTVDPDTIEPEREYRIERGERWRADTLDEWKDVFGADLKKRGRRSAVANITSYLVNFTEEDQDLLIFLLTELSEADLYLKQNQVIPVLIRTGSFLQQCFNERIGCGKNLYNVIIEAYAVGEITDSEVRLAQFIRLCRNDVSHNFSYDTEYGFEVHDHAAICTVTLLNSLLASWFGSQWYVETRLSIGNCIRVVENEFGFEWDSEDTTYEKYSLDPKYDNRD
ncbi:hypothetical protein EGH22_09725 [Halomicroarcula sp. F28]|uniref:hypothetical protein n=1 Tax=Haloarcula salinisoli TaxID=2487746 RepID=UPI001C738929|nr:hypothetical protein [Halomicroarcula salinisoli]MBX0286605.1 hypothetical protein [Halomicroarcula salinisoli]